MLLHRSHKLELVFFQIVDHLICIGKLDFLRLVSLLCRLFLRNFLLVNSFFTFFMDLSLLSEPLPVKIVHLVHGDALILGELLIEPYFAFRELLRFIPIKQKFGISLNEECFRSVEIVCGIAKIFFEIL